MAYSGINQVRKFLKLSPMCVRCKKVKSIEMVECGDGLMAFYCKKCMKHLIKKGFIRVGI